MRTWVLEVDAPGSRVEREVDRDRMIVGRSSECDVQLPDARVSRQHCALERRGDELWIEDLGSRAGTRVNGRTIPAPSRLTHRDRIELSEHSRIVVRDGHAAAAGASAGGVAATVFRDAGSLIVRRQDLDSATSEHDLRRYAERLQLVSEIHQTLVESPSRDVLLEMILDRVFALLHPEQAALLLLDRAGDLAGAVTRPAGLAPERLFFSRSLVREVTSRRQAALVLDAPMDERFAAAASILDSGVRSVLAAPLLVPGGVLGLIVLSSRLQVRQFNEEDLELLGTLASVAALHLRNLELAEEAAERRRMAQELELARRIQLALLPTRLPAVEGYELLGGNVPSRGVSGDLYTVVDDTEHGLIDLLVCDVSGKGMAASLLGASLEALAVGPIEVGHPPDLICERVSRRLFARTPPEKYATGFVAQLDPVTHHLTWANAGHNTALLVRRSGEVEHFAATGPPLGLLASASYVGHATEMGPGDLLLVYTDGITEAADPDGEEFGLERLEALAKEGRATSLQDLRLTIERALDTFVRGVPYADDRTLLCLRRREA